MKIDVFDKNGKSVEKMELDESVFGAEPNRALLAQYLRIFDTNQRQGTSSTKTRAEVRGGGRKPWRQKGTGRARHGSIRSPIWVGGGISHGPQPKDWSLSFPKKMKKVAIVSALSLKQAKKQLKVLDILSFKKPKTKEMTEILGNLELRGRTLLVINKADENILKSTRNIKLLTVSTGETLNGHDLLKNTHVLFLKDAISKVQERYHS
ncbi:50S ribosomal protein L4 [candidate division WWE3 bacterium RIFCSPHIGHO2_01_FULL_42_13]|uniref:Large ribosomal subunit protein uL4 n=1 Tax=candidate division WWE3 bacterium RIFCSPHIGHO2_01_FULL_42_13 TaxID=1802617 RepID=A0A1F4UQN1_UNCKA|nr:MAG: 50S ribosomal protein L4 [candidate division WWE3 bacterium RIFCSPHIGHO2_01_FULL_42_13]